LVGPSFFTLPGKVAFLGGHWGGGEGDEIKPANSWCTYLYTYRHARKIYIYECR